MGESKTSSGLSDSIQNLEYDSTQWLSAIIHDTAVPTGRDGKTMIHPIQKKLRVKIRGGRALVVFKYVILPLSLYSSSLWQRR